MYYHQVVVMRRYLIAIMLAAAQVFAASAPDHLTVYLGQSHVMDFDAAIRRVSIANTDIADASVTSSTQMLLNGKAAGVTSLVVWDEQDRVHQFRLTVQAERCRHQVMLQVRFVEVNKNNLKEFGVDALKNGLHVGSELVDMASFAGKVSAPSDPLGLGEAVDFFVNIPTQNVSAIIKALEEKNLLTVLAKPNLCVMDGTEASFLAGGRFPVPIVSGSAGMQTVTIQFEEYGIKLFFTPTVLDSGLVNIKVTAEVSSLDFENGVLLSGFRIPNINARRAESRVELRENQYLIIGGLMSNETAKTISKIPLLGSIPVLGKLFSSHRYVNKESELLIMVSPQIVEAMQLP
ncbi:MAG: Type II secretion system protein D precursor [bacterium ADurb.Bin478]|nr:MAG: Type II secretion system protein D precursor [bacterium ADurb.Bin478]